MTARKTPINGVTVLLAGGLMAALLGLMLDVQTKRSNSSGAELFSGCTGDIQSHVALTEEHLANVLAIPERDSKNEVREILAEPYCILPTVQIRSGVDAEREAYPLTFNDQAWLIVLFEGNEYAGYRISTRLE
ncbi:MAG: hypothetical protein VKL39_10965 [Leptolyngbyaceae bacterium]|nr:hypothetical protein [Leptolyngbyaceae bacterium]